MAMQRKPETLERQVERVRREIGHMGEFADSYVRDFGEAGARALMQEKFEELGRLTGGR